MNPAAIIAWAQLIVTLAATVEKLIDLGPDNVTSEMLDKLQQETTESVARWDAAKDKDKPNE